DRTGSGFADVEIPNFLKDRFAASGLIVSSGSPSVMAQKTVLSDVMPLVPTSTREFDRNARVTAFMRFYQGGSKSPGTVRVTATIVDSADHTNFERTQEFGGAAFVASPS